MLSLLAFTVDDLTGSELFGQPLDRIVLAVDNRDLSGDFTADLTDPEAALMPVSASAESTLSFPASPCWKNRSPAGCWSIPSSRKGTR